MQGLVAYKSLAYKPTPTPPSKPLTFCKSQTNKVSVTLEPWIVDDDDDDEEDDELALFRTGTIVKDPHHLGSLTHRQQGLKLRRT